MRGIEPTHYGAGFMNSACAKAVCLSVLCLVCRFDNSKCSLSPFISFAHTLLSVCRPDGFCQARRRLLEFVRLSRPARAAFGEERIAEVEKLRGCILHITYFYLVACPASHFLYVAIWNVVWGWSPDICMG